MKWLQRKPKKKPNSNSTIREKIALIRGIEDANMFLSPTQDVLHDPYLMKNIEDASNRIIRAIGNNERIVVSYDPDADGLTATTVMLRYLRNYTENVDYIYGERNDGHGITEQLKTFSTGHEERNQRSRENLAKIQDCDLLILIDSSSNDTQTCHKIAEELEKDIIILDHHAIERNNPHVLLVNPQQEGCQYPNKQLSGAGVVFKVIQVMEDTLGQVDPWQFIDLVAVGMYADIMRVDIPENRYLIMHGMRNMQNVGLVRILKGGKVNMFNGIKCDDIGFTIAPLLNGVARLDNIKLAIDILQTDDDKVAKKLRLQMDKLNKARKAKQKEIVEQYMKNIDTDQKVLIVMDEQSSKGFNGLVAQQLSDTYQRPVIVGRLHNGELSGSFRSFGGFNLKQFLADSALIEEAQGHNQAGGITVKEGNLEGLLKYIENNLPELESKERVVIYDLEMDVSEIGEYLGEIERFNLLTGNGFPKVVARVNNITVDDTACIGETQETVKIKTFDDMELIKFRVNDQYASELSTFDTIDAVGTLSMNIFYNFKTKVTTRTPQVMLESYQVN
jgi:single-stranded-DNA-specific exonuclease